MWVRVGLAMAVAFGASAQMKPPPPPDFDLSAAQKKALTDAIVAELREKYALPEKLDQGLPELKKRWAKPEFQQLKSAQAVTEAINADLKSVFNDGHLGLKRGPLPPGMIGDPDKIDPERDRQMKERERRMHYGVLKAEILPGNIGYLEVVMFPSRGPGEQQAYADALGFVRDTAALIVDVRKNGGGDGESVADLVAYFLDKPVLLQTEYFRWKDQKKEHWSSASVAGPKYGTARPVYVLTSKKTFSAAEEFAYDLQTQKRATIVGESTGGGAHHNMFVPVGEGFALSISYGVVKNAVTGKSWEGTGVKPDVEAPAADALLTAQRLELEKQVASEADPMRKRGLEMRLADLKDGGGPNDAPRKGN